MKQELLKRQNDKRNEKLENPNEKDKNEKLNKELEDMCIFGNIMKNQIIEEKFRNPEKYIEINEALNLEKEDQGLFALGLLGNILEQNGTEVIIEKEDNTNKNEQDEAITTLQFISSGLAQKTKYSLHFDFGDQRNEQLLNDKNEYNKFKEKLIEKLSKDYNIPKNKIIVTLPKKGSVSVQVIFQSDEFNNLNVNDFINKFKNDYNYPELQNLKEVHTDVIMEGCKLSKNQLDSRGNRVDWPTSEERRGNKPYNAPVGWIGIGLKVMDKYDNGNNTWIGMQNIDGEWCVAYHGVARGNTPENVSKITGLIAKSGFKPSTSGAATDDDDLRHPGKKCGLGVYCSPDIEYAETYAGITEFNGERYKCVMMLRINPEKIRQSKTWQEEYILEPNSNEIRPYRILLKKC